MRKIYLLFISLLLFSCRVETDFIEIDRKQKVSKKFITFTKKHENDEIDYAKGFSYLALRYDSLHQSNITGRKSVEKILDRLKVNRKVHSSELNDIEYIDFSIRSEVMEEENGDKWVLYPRIQNGKVKNLVSAVLSEEETVMGYYTLEYPNEWYIANIELFRKAYEDAKRERNLNNEYITSEICGISSECIIKEIILVPTRPDEEGGGSGGYFGGGHFGGGGSDGGGDGCPAYAACSPGSSNGGGYTPPNNDDNTDPCEKLKEKHKPNSDYSKKFQELNKKEIFNKNYEVGFYEKAGDGFTKLEGENNSTSLELPNDKSGIYGIMHTHNNKNGVVKIFSPTDVRTFINELLKNAKSFVGSYTDAYSTVVTSEGSYTLKFSKETHPGGVNYDTKLEWDNWYEKEMAKIQNQEDGSFNQADIEKVFMRFMTEKVKIDGLEVYKTTPSNSSKMNYNNNKVSTDNPC